MKEVLALVGIFEFVMNFTLIIALMAAYVLDAPKLVEKRLRRLATIFIFISGITIALTF